MTFECTHCQQLESELMRLERIHAERLRILQANSEVASSQEGYDQIRNAERRAWLDMQMVREEMARHKLRPHRAE